MADSVQTIEAKQILDLAKTHCLIDARSPSEFAAGHIPGAVNVPILDDNQRHEVGICYKQKGNTAAVELGFQLAGGEFADKIRTANTLAQGRRVVVYCWRGGQRSTILSWLLSTVGLKIQRLEGGYKAFRQYANHFFSRSYALMMITGKTGSGKTEILQSLAQAGHNVIDLERLANHRGSAFGGINMPPQPTQEHFENCLAFELAQMSGGDVWVEGESRFIGKVRIPDDFFTQMQNCASIQIELPLASRMHRVLEEYGHYDREILKEKTQSITKRMGGDKVKICLEALDQGDMHGWVMPLLEYYDKTYLHGIESRLISPRMLVVDGMDMEKIITEIIAYGKNASA
jgi:tRNA 2-selenouridine synthase